MTDDDRWRDVEPPTRGPSAPPDLQFSALAVGIGVFAGVGIPIFVVGYTRSSGVNVTIILIGVAVGLVAGLVAGLWVDHRRGRVWRGRRM